MTDSHEPTVQAPRRCPDCGADVRPSDERCWLCQRALSTADIVTAELVEPPAPPIVPQWVQAQRANPTQFSLETLMLVVTLVAVCLGMLAAAPGLGILASIVAAPALIRTLIAGYQERAAGSQLSLGEKVIAFLASTGVTIAVLSAGATAFLAACFASCLVVIGISNVGQGPGGGIINDDAIIYSALGFSILVGLATTIWLFWLLRPQRAARRP